MAELYLIALNQSNVVNAADGFPLALVGVDFVTIVVQRFVFIAERLFIVVEQVIG